jgi:hypothetical protein
LLSLLSALSLLPSLSRSTPLCCGLPTEGILLPVYLKPNKVE